MIRFGFFAFVLLFYLSNFTPARAKYTLLDTSPVFPETVMNKTVGGIPFQQAIGFSNIARNAQYLNDVGYKKIGGINTASFIDSIQDTVGKIKSFWFGDLVPVTVISPPVTPTRGAISLVNISRTVQGAKQVSTQILGDISPQNNSVSTVTNIIERILPIKERIIEREVTRVEAGAGQPVYDKAQIDDKFAKLRENIAVPSFWGTGISSYNKGDIFYATGSSTLAKLASYGSSGVGLNAGTPFSVPAGHVLTMSQNGGVPIWAEAVSPVNNYYSTGGGGGSPGYAYSLGNTNIYPAGTNGLAGGTLTINGELVVNNTSTSTMSRGVDISAGCFSIGGTCIGTGGSLSSNVALLNRTSQIFTALNIFSAGASTTRLSVFNNFYAGGTATTTINSSGDLYVAGSTTLQNFTFVNVTGTNATTTNLAVEGTASTSRLVVSNALTISGFSGALSASAGIVSAGTLSIANGGTNASSFTTSGNGVYYDGTRLVTAPLTSAVTYPYASTTMITATTASTTALNVSGTATFQTLTVAGNTTLAATMNGPLQANAGLVSATSSVGVLYGGTGQTTFTNGELLIGNSTGNTLTKATLTGTTNQLTVTNGSGSITLSLPSLLALTQASTTRLSVIDTAYFGGTATTTINSAGLITAQNLLALGSTTLQDFTAVNATTSQATTTSLYVSGPTKLAGSLSLAPSVRTSGSLAPFLFTGAADTGLTAATEASDIQFNLNRTKTHSNNPITLQRDVLINAGTHAFTSFTSGLITDLATLGITGAPLLGTNATSTNAHTIYLGASALNASTTNSYGLTVNANTGAGSNYAATFLGGNVGIGTSSPAWTLSSFSASAPQLALSAGAGVAQWALRNAGGNLYFATTTVAGTATTTTSALTVIGSSGNVGIGTSNPLYKFDTQIAGNTHLFLHPASDFGGGRTGVVIDNRNDADSASVPLVFGASSFEFNEGKVGIGTSSPYAPLSIVGETVSAYFTATTTTASTFPYASTTAISSTGSAYFATSGGKVGIGTTTPSYGLDINQATAGMNNSNANGVEFHLKNTNGSSRDWVMLSTGSSWAGGGQEGFFNIYDNTAGVQRLTINTSGNVGIGTTSPATKLDIYGAAIPLGFTGITTGTQYMQGANTGGSFRLGLESSTGDSMTGSGLAYATVLGSVNSTALQLATNNAARLTIDTSGNVGIGTTTPSQILDVEGANPAITIWSTSAGGVQGIMQSFSTTDLRFGTNTNHPLSFYTNGQERMRLNTSGNVGIGTTTPGLNTGAFGTSARYLSITGGGSNPGVIEVGASTTVSGNSVGGVQFYNYANPNTTTANHASSTVVAGIASSVVNDGVNNLNANGGTLLFYTKNSNGGLDTTSPRMVIDHSGNTGFSTLAGAAANHLCYDTTTITGYGGTINTLATCSSLRKYKENINDLTLGLDTVMKLRPVAYNWKKTGDADIGFIAEDMFEINPVFGSFYQGKLDGVKYEHLTAVLARAIQELNLNFESLASSTAPIVTNISASTSTSTSEKTFLGRFFDRLSLWFADTTNGIGDFFANRVRTKILCVGDIASGETCITKMDLDRLLQNNVGTVITPQSSHENNSGAVPNLDDLSVSSGAMVDTEAPILTLVGNATSTLNVGDSYVDPGAT